MSIPKIDPYPPAPTPEDDEATFDEKAYEHAASLEPRRVQMNEVATYVNTRAADANSRAVAAAASATASSNSAARADEWANKAPGSVVASGKYSARHYSDLSDKFANAPEDVEVEPGKYSALHWQEKAKKIANVHATTVATDLLPTVLATNVQEALQDLAYQADQLRVAKNQLKYGDGPYPVLDFQFAGAKLLDPRIQFIRASTATYTDAMGITRTAAINEPRLTYDPTTREAKGLLIEEQRTNTTLNSQFFDGSEWSVIGGTCTPTDRSSPLVDHNWWKVEATESSSFQGRLVQSIDVVGGQRIVASHLVSRADSRWVAVTMEINGVGGRRFWFDLVDGVKGETGSASGGNFDFGYGIEKISEDTYLVWTWVLPTESGRLNCFIWPAHNNNASTSHVGDNFLIAYRQTEEGSRPSSYIPTEDAQVTRAAERASQRLGEEFNPREGTWLLDVQDFRAAPSARLLRLLPDGGEIRNNNGGSGVITSGPFGALVIYTGEHLARQKIAISYKVGGPVRIYRNGVHVGDSTQDYQPGEVDTVDMSTGNATHTNISRLYFSRALSETELQELTK